MNERVKSLVKKYDDDYAKFFFYIFSIFSSGFFISMHKVSIVNGEHPFILWQTLFLTVGFFQDVKA